MRTGVAFATDGGVSATLALVNRVMTGSPSDRLWIIYGHRAGDHPEELEQLLGLKDRYLDRLALGVVTERDEDQAELLSGTLDAAKIRAFASRLFDAKRIDDYFVFGPDSLSVDVRGALSELGVDGGRIQVEQAAHGTDPQLAATVARGTALQPAAAAARGTALQPTATAASGAAVRPTATAAPGQRETQVSFVMDGRKRAFSIRTDDESIVDGAARAGIELPFSCKAGVCATCRTKLVRGEVEMAQNYALEDWELEQGFILACQSHAKTPEIELTYDEK